MRRTFKERIGEFLFKAMEWFYRINGFHVSEDGICTCTTWFSTFICEMGVRSGDLVKIDNKQYQSSNQ